MRISELIKNLKKEKNKHGDLLVTIYDGECGTYSLDVATARTKKSKSKVMAFDKDVEKTFLSVMDDCYLC